MCAEIVRGNFGTGVPPSNGGGGDGGNLEARLARLEASVTHVEGDIGRVEGNLKSIDGRLRAVEGDSKTLLERVAHLPSKGFIVVTVLGGFSLFAGIFGFHEQLIKLLGLTGN